MGKPNFQGKNSPIDKLSFKVSLIIVPIHSTRIQIIIELFKPRKCQDLDTGMISYFGKAVHNNNKSICSFKLNSQEAVKTTYAEYGGYEIIQEPTKIQLSLQGYINSSSHLLHLLYHHRTHNAYCYHKQLLPSKWIHSPLLTLLPPLPLTSCSHASIYLGNSIPPYSLLTDHPQKGQIAPIQ